MTANQESDDEESKSQNTNKIYNRGSGEYTEDEHSESAKTRMIRAGVRIGEENDTSQDNFSGESAAADMLS